MKKGFPSFAFVGLVLFSSVLVNAADFKEVILEKGKGQYTVPKGKIWKVEGLSPALMGNKGIGTADFNVNGEAFIGEKKDFSMYGKFQLSVNQKQTAPIWFSEGSQVEVWESRGTAKIKEYASK